MTGVPSVYKDQGLKLHPWIMAVNLLAQNFPSYLERQQLMKSESSDVIDSGVNWIILDFE